jgi:hypothetical protein
MRAATAAICASGQATGSLHDWNALSAFLTRHPVSPSTRMRCGAAFGSGSAWLPMLAWRASAGSAASHTLSAKADGFESAALLAVVRCATVPAATRSAMRRLLPSTVTSGQLAWLVAARAIGRPPSPSTTQRCLT